MKPWSEEMAKKKNTPKEKTKVSTAANGARREVGAPTFEYELKRERERDQESFDPDVLQREKKGKRRSSVFVRS